MFDIEYIAVPVDFSRSSKNALRLAHALADKATTVEAVHVVDRWPQFMNDVLFPYAPLGEDAVEIEGELVRAALAAITQYHDLEDEPAVQYGPLQETLLAHLRSTPAEIVVMGAAGETGAIPDVLGSVAQRLVRSMNRPTVLVREMGAEKIERILVAIDLTEGSKRVLEFAIGIAQRTGAELEILHVVPDPLVHDHSNVLSSALKFDRKQVASKIQHRVEALFERLMRSLDPSYAEQHQVRDLSTKRIVALGDPAAEILTRADARSADLVVIGAHRSGATRGSHLGGVAAKVGHRSTSHVAVVPMPSPGRLAQND